MTPIIRVAVIALAGSVAFAGPKVASDMPQSTASGMVDVIVQYKSFSDLANRKCGGPSGRIHRNFRSIPATHMTVPVAMISRLASNPRVAYISPDRTTIELAGYHRADRERQHWCGAKAGMERASALP